MKKIKYIITLLLLTSLFLSACAPALSAPAETTAEDTPGVTTNKKEEKTEEETNEKPAEEKIMQKEDPKNDGVLNLLMYGNSACYYYTNELFQVAKEAGVKMKVCNIYYSGCRLKQHWDFWKTNQAPYEYFVTDETGRKKVNAAASLDQCLRKENWDVITIQEAVNPVRSLDRDLVFRELEPYTSDLLGHIQKNFPMSTIMYHQTWSSEIGYDAANGSVLTKEAQDLQHQVIRDVAITLCQKYNLQRIPVGDAWQIARADTRVGDTLCHKNGTVGDYGHDGDTGGGRYLNACVWFEVLTGKSCIGNTWRPDYDLSEQKITALQEAAHKAVQNL